MLACKTFLQKLGSPPNPIADVGARQALFNSLRRTQDVL